jgi:hypothetical protein
MTVQSIDIKDILVEKSRFSCTDHLFEEKAENPSLLRSFKNTGILNPVTVYQEGHNIFHLVDGRKRVRYAESNMLKNIDAVVLPGATPAEEIINLILCNKDDDIESSIINRVQFVRFALLSGAREAWVLDTICPSFGFKPGTTFLDDCERICSLPGEIRSFCHEKRYSLKQILNLAHYPGDILISLISWKQDLQLTASIMDEIASGLKDYLRSQDMTIEDFLSDPGLREIIDSALNARDRTERLRRFIFLKRFPVLSGVNARIREIVEALDLPEEITIDWDKTLENRRVTLDIKIKDPREWASVMERLGSQEIETAIKEILKEL